jgi:lipopolysaccharide heptosyltransferase II
MQRPIILAPNWLGDAVMALPAIADIVRQSPGAAIAVAARPAIAPLFRMVRGVAEVIELPRRSAGGWRERDGALAGRGFDTAILLPNSFQSALTAARARIAERWGYRTDWRRPLLTRAIAPPANVHQVEYYQCLVRALGFANGAARPALDVSPGARAAGSAALTRAGWDARAPLVALAPGAAYGGAKRWPPEYFADLARSLQIDGVVAVLVGSAADRTAGDAIVTASGGAAVVNLIGATDLAALAGVLAHCRTLVSNDSGAMHIAAAIGTPVTAVFGPTDDRATRPIGDAHVVLTHRVWCRPCMLRECPLDHRCMRGLAANTVLAAARRTW